MTTTAHPDESPGSSMTDEEYGALRASAALWAGTSVLITDQRGRVLVQHVDYRNTCLLPGGAVGKGESPSRGASRELLEELGITTAVTRSLAVDWVSADTPSTPPAMRFPGEILYVYDSGTWNDQQIASIRLPGHEITAVDLVEPATLNALMAPSDARRALSALRARINAGGPVFLENGLPIAPTVLDRVGILRTARVEHHFPWRPGPVLAGLPVRQCWAWAFAPDGRVLVLLKPDTGAACLPGGTLETQDQGDPVATLMREAAEEAATHLDEPVFLGHLLDPTEPCAHVHFAATLTRLGPVRSALATGQAHARILATPEQAVALFNWGPETAGQLATVHAARERLGIPKAAAQPVTELPGPVTW
ncbi:NUDIX domain-containing protein [Streptomyces sp. NPDC050388]|uniref:NUDIX hydrolase n=1 Tax=Streptomyces sp. NPDC050388 TaxID=3155781 RepID=UPI003422AE11